MAQDPVDFDVIEGHKENIQALPSGRSAKKLAALFSPTSLQKLPTPTETRHANDAVRIRFESEIANIAERDDPLDVYDRYVRWTLDAYPSAQATPFSGLHTLLERATKAFVQAAQYKDDPRYLKIWIHYIHFFSDAPREAYVFLSRHGIGEGLALFYEEYAAWLEGAGRWAQAEEVYKLGIEREAHPASRLLRKFGEFEARRDRQTDADADADAADAPASPALPAARPALAAKLDPFATHAAAAAAAAPSAAATAAAANPQAPRQTSGIAGRQPAGKPGKAKMSIFSDADADADAAQPAMGSHASGSRGWDSIGSLVDRKKENAAEPKPWVGETLKAGGMKNTEPKMAVFRDASQNRQWQSIVVLPVEHQVTVHPQTMKKERVFVDLVAVYPNPEVPGTELGFEEIWARRRGWLDVGWAPGSDDGSGEGLLEDDGRSTAQSPAASRQSRSPPEKLVVRQDTMRLDGDVALAHRPRKMPAEKLVVRQDTIRLDASPAPLQPTKVEKLVVRPDAGRLDENGIPVAEGRRPSSTTQKVPLRGDGETLLLDENGAVKEKPRGCRGKKKMMMEANETQIIKAKLDSPSGPRIKRRGDKSEPTMTLHTKAATDDIYEIFNQPLKSAGRVQPDEQDETSDDDYETDVDYASVADSTGTTRQLAMSEAGDDYEEGPGDDDPTEARSVSSDWSEFTTSKHIPDVSGENSHATETTTETREVSHFVGMEDSTGTEGEGFRDGVEEERDGDESGEESGEDSLPRTRTIFVPIPPEDYEPPTRPYRDPAEAANNRLPFMTPITECTESSVNMQTGNRSQRWPYETPSKRHRYGHDRVDEEEGEEEEEEEGEGDEDHELGQPRTPAGSTVFGSDTSSPVRSVAAGSPSPAEKAGTPPKLKPGVPADAAAAAAAAVAVAVRGEPVIKDLQCNPVDDRIREEILAGIHPPLDAYPGFLNHQHEKYGRGSEIRKFIRATTKAKSNGDRTAAALPPVVLDLPETYCEYTIKKELGAGAFAPVYLVENSRPGPAHAAAAAAGKEALAVRRRRSPLEALKVEQPPSPWEFYVMRLAHARLGAGHRAVASLSVAHELHLYQDEAFLVLPFHPHGTLLDVVNLFRAEQSGVMDEMLAMFFSVELMRTVEALHSHGILHADLKADNCMLRIDCGESGAAAESAAAAAAAAPAAPPPLASQYRADGRGGWAVRGISLIDFGRGIDMRSFAPDVQFVADWKVAAQDCSEAREGRPWTWQIDYHGLAGIVHCLLFGRYMETARADVGSGLGLGAGARRYRIREGLKRYWQTDIWGDLFDVLLNPGAHVAGEDGGRMPVSKTLGGIREKMERWLENNCEKGVGLKALVGKVEAHAMGRR